MAEVSVAREGGSRSLNPRNAVRNLDYFEVPYTVTQRRMVEQAERLRFTLNRVPPPLRESIRQQLNDMEERIRLSRRGLL